MRARLLASCLAVLAGCSLIQQPDEPVWGVVVVNESDEEVVIVLDQGGREDRLPVAPCSSSANGLGPGHAWRVEYRGPVIREQDVSFVPNAPVTVVEVAVSPTGEVTVAPERGAESLPDAPIPADCAGADLSPSMPRAFDVPVAAATLPAP